MNSWDVGEDRKEQCCVGEGTKTGCDERRDAAGDVSWRGQTGNSVDVASVQIG